MCMCQILIDSSVCGSNNQHSMLYIHNEKIYDIYMDDLAEMKCQLHHLHLYKHSFNNNMMKISGIYVSITIPNINI